MKKLSCKIHTLDFIIYCVDCNCLVCVQCLVEKHQKHEVETTNSLIELLGNTTISGNNNSNTNQKTNSNTDNNNNNNNSNNSKENIPSVSNSTSSSETGSNSSTDKTNTNPTPQYSLRFKFENKSSSKNSSSSESNSATEKREILFVQHSEINSGFYTVDVDSGAIDLKGKSKISHDGSVDTIFDKKAEKIYLFGGKKRDSHKVVEVFNLKTKESQLYPLEGVQGAFISSAYDGERYIYFTNFNLGAEIPDLSIDRFDTWDCKVEKFGMMEFKRTMTTLVHTKFKNQECLFIFNDSTVHKITIDGKKKDGLYYSVKVGRLDVFNYETHHYDGNGSIFFFKGDRAYQYSIEDNYTKAMEYDNIVKMLGIDKSSKSFIYFSAREDKLAIGRQSIGTDNIFEISEFSPRASQRVFDFLSTKIPIGFLPNNEI